MKYLFLKEIVSEAAEELRLGAAYNGEHHDGGCSNLLSRLDTYQNNLVVKLDLRPSEFNQLNDIDVDEPKEFSDVIEKYKIRLAKNIRL